MREVRGACGLLVAVVEVVACPGINEAKMQAMTLARILAREVLRIDVCKRSVLVYHSFSMGSLIIQWYICRIPNEFDRCTLFEEHHASKSLLARVHIAGHPSN